MVKILTSKYFSNPDTVRVARSLIGKFLVVDDGMKRAYMITEVEAYDGFNDKASHAHRGKTVRNAPMFGAPSTWYVYLVYGMHWMLNIVTGPRDYPAAILIRGVYGVSGPGTLTRLIGINGSYNNQISGKKSRLWIEDRNITVPTRAIKSTPRIGVSYAGAWAKKPYRFLLVDDACMWKRAEKKIVQGGIAVVPTDTIYGVVASAFSKRAVEKIYTVRGRNSKKPCIVLISDIKDLRRFGVTLLPAECDLVRSWWPGPVSVVFPGISQEFSHLHRGVGSLAFRIPNNQKLRNLIKTTGPIIAPSANRESEPPARTIAEAHAMFGDAIDTHVDGGLCKSPPSTVVAFENGAVRLVRAGAYRIKL